MSGYWDGTCGVTHLPIKQDDPVRLILLTENNYGPNMGGGFCYHSELTTPQFCSIKGTYDGQGCIIPPEDWHTDYVLARFKKWLADKTIVIIKKDGPWKKKELDPRRCPTLLNWLNAIERGYVWYAADKARKLPKKQWQFMLVHEEIYHLGVSLLNDLKKKNGRDYDATIDQALKSLRQLKKTSRDLSKKEARIKLWLALTDKKFDMLKIFFTGMAMWDDHMIEYIRDQLADEEKVKESLHAVAEFRHFFDFMGMIHCPFQMQSGAGDTGSDEAPLLYMAVFRVATLLAQKQLVQIQEENERLGMDIE